jgi:peptidoglycan hydrolase-like protein with peptidoglycan-binding domain
MGDADRPQSTGTILHLADGSVSGEHSDPASHPFLVAPQTEEEKNTLRPGLFPIACWKLDDIRFDFDSSFIKPEAEPDVKKLGELIKSHPKAPVSIFGHADPVGKETYNKKLSGRRAKTIYGLLTRDLALWEDLYSSPYHGDHWGPPQVVAMLGALGYTPGDKDGLLKGNESDVLKKFQSDHGLTSHGYINASTRKELFSGYMDKLCGPDFKLTKSDFLARGADTDGRGDYQGCSEFNPLLILSQDEDREFSKPARHKERNAVNAPNRRVMVFLFRPGVKVIPGKWPCPKADTEAVQACKDRFWSDAKKRLQNTSERRNYTKDGDTLGCRFYDRLSSHSPCEQMNEYWVVRILVPSSDPLPKRKPLANEAYTLIGTGSGAEIRGRTDNDGILRAVVRAETPSIILQIAGTTMFLKGGALLGMPLSDMAARQRLYNLGYGDLDFDSWDDDAFTAALKKFQKDHGLTESGSPDAATKEKLREVHGS